MIRAAAISEQSVTYPLPASHASGGAVRGVDWRAAESPRPYRPDSRIERIDQLALSVSGASSRVVPVLARVAAALRKAGAPEVFGYARMKDFCVERYGRSSRWFSDLVRLDEIFEQLPSLRAAVTGDDGDAPVHPTAAMVIGGVADASTAPEWIARARRMTLRELRRAARSMRQGDGVGHPPDGDRVVGPEPRGSSTAPATGGELSGSAAAGSSVVAAAASFESDSSGPCGSGAGRSDLESPGSDFPGAGAFGPAESGSRMDGPGADSTASTDRKMSGPTGSADSDSDEDHVELRFRLPGTVRAAFHETLDLFRAVEGTESPVASFVEALIAEAMHEAGFGPGENGDGLREDSRDPGAADAAGSPGTCSSSMPGGEDARGQCAAASPGSRGACDEAADATASAAGPQQVREPQQDRGWLDDPDLVPLAHSASRDAIERSLADAAEGWRSLRRDPQAPWGLRLAGSSLEELQRLEKSAGMGDARRLDRQLCRLLRIQNEVELFLGDVLEAMGRMGGWNRLGFAGAGHYAERRLGISRSVAEDRMWVARAIKRFPLVRVAYERGELGWEATRVILQLLKGYSAGDSGQRAWIERGRQSTVKRLRDEARMLHRDASLSAPAESPARAGWLPAAPLPMTDDAWHAARRREPGTSSAWMKRLGAALVQRMGQAGGVDDASGVSDAPGAGDGGRVDGARDGGMGTPSRRMVAHETLWLRLPESLAGDFLESIERRRGLLERAASAGGAGGRIVGDESASRSVVRMFSTQGRRLPRWVGLLSLLEGFVRAWDHDGGRRMPRGRLETFARAGYRCEAPGCTSRRNLQSHHIEFRSRGGGDDLPNRCGLCAFHHLKGIHEGLSWCRGEAPLGLTWRLGRRDVGEFFRNELRVTAPDRAKQGG